MLTAERAPDAPQDHVPKGTTPTWEMELLLSGATVFGLLQLPGAIDPPAFSLMMRLDDGLGPGVTVLWLYLRTSILTLSATFVVHLALRAYWAALVGMRSVYPGPLRWDRLRVGPIQREAVEKDVSDFAARIEAADNRATRVFGIGVAVAFLIFMPLVLVAAGVGLGWALRALGGPDVSQATIFGLVAVAIGPILVLSLVDRRFGGRLRPEGRPRRVLRAIFRAYNRVGFGGAANPLIALFQSGEGMVRTMLILVGTMAVAIVLVMNQFRLAMGEEGVGDFAGLPADDAGAFRSSSPQHYLSGRQQGLAQQVPYLPDRVVKGPYVELFVPYRPARHAPAMRAACGEAVRVVEQEGPPAEALACLARVLDIRLDGAPVEVPLDATSDPLSDARGVVAMIPAQDLAPGRHELTVARIARKGAEKPAVPYRIPFWR
ncbi:MAG: hypothetical protein U0229_21630 [Anaeromyxobacter sp.]